ncbi:MAG TPA: pyridoxal-phosphate dependent enzyme [Myxococcota bacterium]|nr:pyridoxal-phosphate dependent enzyme [Myxococcota bacterium]
MSLGSFERDDVGDFPTPVEEVTGLGIWAKREDRSHTLYGGNKVRKLAYLLPEARRRGGDMLTLGATGSHHLLACSLHGKRFGVRTHALVLPQPSTPHVEKNWSRLQLEAASITMVPKEILLPLAAIDAAEKVHRSHGRWPYFVWAGGSTPLGSLGWVEGGLELGQQVKRGECPEPTDLFAALGSGGTVAGLLVGLQMAGLSTRLHAVRVVDRAFANRSIVLALARSAGRRLGVRVDGERLRVWHSEFGGGYGVPTESGNRAMDLGREHGLSLEPTYTAKTLAAALSWRQEGRVVMFLDSLSSATMV